jgi:hypothetical protein
MRMNNCWDRENVECRRAIGFRLAETQIQTRQDVATERYSSWQIVVAIIFRARDKTFGCQQKQQFGRLVKYNFTKRRASGDGTESGFHGLKFFAEPVLR